LKRRPDLVILMDILAALLEGPKLPTRIAQACNLNYENFVKWVELLESKNLVSRSSEQGHGIYSLTPDGYQVLQDFRKVIERLRL
jgi:predicted transcriptional regulator